MSTEEICSCSPIAYQHGNLGDWKPNFCYLHFELGGTAGVISLLEKQLILGVCRYFPLHIKGNHYANMTPIFLDNTQFLT